MFPGSRGWLFGLCLLVGGAGSSLGVTVFDAASEWRWRKATAEASSPDTRAWRERGFDDSAWGTGRAPFFYGEVLQGMELPDMRGGYTGLYLRKVFTLTDPAALGRVTLNVLSDDGFAAWINGRLVVRFNVPEGEIPYSGTASGTFNEPLPVETYDITPFRDALVAGDNVVAVHALNASLSDSSDFVFQMALEAEVDETPPGVSLTTPADGERVRELASVTVVFTEPVQGVDAEDLLVQGTPAVRMTAFGDDQYVFEFPPIDEGTVVFRWAAGHGITDRSPRLNPWVGGSWQCVVDPDLPVPGVTISEFMADNEDTLNDEDGDASDWIEIENASDVTVDLTGWGLSDDTGDPFRWKFPGVSLPPRSYLIVFASGKDRRIVGGRLHTNFGLSRGGGFLGLIRPGGQVVSVYVAYPPQLEDVSYGRLTTDPGATGFFTVATPGAPNADGGPGFAPEVRYSRIGGTFLTPFALRLSASDPRATIRYTLNGAVPTETSEAFNAPLTIAGSTRVRARAFVPGLLPGPVGGEYFVQLNPSAAGATSDLPLVIIHSFGRGTVPANGEYPAFLAIQEPRGGVSSLTNAPDLRTRVNLNIRGSSTQGLPKRSYRVEFRDEREADRKLSPLGLPAEADWVLYAPNNFEPILIHNPLMYGLSRELGRYAPRTRFVELYIMVGSGALATTSYAGIYVLMEKIERGADRVAIDRLEPEHTALPEVTGGYLLKIDRLDPGDSGLSAGGQLIGFVDPKEPEMEVPQRLAQRNYLRTYLNAFSTALNGANWRDPRLGWRPYVDEGAWLDHHILNVVAFNVDALRLSAYFHKPREGPLTFGPLWDFDRSLNSTDGRDANPRVWANGGGTDFFNYPWWSRLFRDPDFWQHWIDRYQELRAGELSTNHLFALVDRWTGEVRAAQPREAAKWPGFTSPRVSYASEISSLKTWLTRRLEFMDTNFLARPRLSPNAGQVVPGTLVQLRGPTGATLHYTLDGSDPRDPGGTVAASARTYTQPIRVDGPVVVRARAFHANHRNRTGALSPPLSSSWSGVIQARFGVLPVPTPAGLQVTEVHYRPSPPDARELAANPMLTDGDFEFVELRNTASAAVDLHDIRFVKGIGFDFRNSAVPILGAGERLVLARNTAALALRYGAVSNVAGEFGGALDGSGESLRLENAAGTVIAEVEYRDGWHPATDGLGYSLVRREESDLGSLGSGAVAWRASARPGGSPGFEDPAPDRVGGAVVNEVLTHTDPPQQDGIELHNPQPTPVDVGGWYLTDDRSQPTKFRIPAGTVIPAGGHLWIDESQFNASTQREPFRLDSTGDAVWLFAADAHGVLTGYAHGFDFGSALNGISFGREVTCDDRELFVPQVRWTPGAVNAGPVIGPVVLSEVHYHPPDIPLGIDALNDTALEFVELANISGADVPLFDPEHPETTWRLRDAVAYAFPTGAVLRAGGVLLVVPFDPDNNPQAKVRLVSALAVPPGVPMFGPYEGSLPNSDGRIELVRPDQPQGPADPEPGRVPWVLVDGVGYSDRAPWAIAADGGGASLQRVDLAGPGDRPGVWMALRPTPGVTPDPGEDRDRDGMPDFWEARWCLDPADGTDAGVDSDGDGASNGSEYLAGTRPRDDRDVLAWTTAVVDAAGVVLHFQAKPGRAYAVEVRDGVAGGAWRRWRDITAGLAEEMITVRDPDGGRVETTRFYRLRLSSPER